MKIDGGCHCGNITYEAEIDPERVVVCHCGDCQVLAGSALRTSAFTREGGFKLLSGELKTYVRTADSGHKRTAAFCPECGTPIYGSTIGEGLKFYVIRIGSARQRNELVPKLQIWTGSAQRWVDDLGSIPKCEKQELVVKDIETWTKGVKSAST